MYLETARLCIRDFVPEDADALHEILGDAETMQFCEPAYTPEQTQQFLAAFCIGRHGAVAAVHRRSGRLIGYILFNRYTDSVYEMGWMFNRSFWHRGYAFEACSAVIEHAFTVLHIHRIFAETIDGGRSARLMQRLGMHLEGTLRRHARDNAGLWRDMYLYGILDTDRGRYGR